MSQLSHPTKSTTGDHPDDRLLTQTERRLFANPGREAYWLLRAVFVLAPLIAGLDKFFNLLTDWQAYLSGPARNMLGGSTQVMMYAVGVLEIALAVGVAVKPRIFGYAIALWLMAIVILNLLPGGMYALALRDIGLALSAIALARLAAHHDRMST